MLGRLNYIARFISQLTDKCRPIYKLLKKNAKIHWDAECEEAFNEIKQYLINPPVLVSPKPGQPLFLYLTILPESMGCMLGQRDQNGKERAIYYLSKKFTEGEQRYSEIERTCCALVWIMHRLRQYTLYYTIELITKHDPIKYLAGKPTLIGKISKWQMLLSEFDISYVSQNSTKGQALADQLAECPIDDEQTGRRIRFPDESILLTELDKEREVPRWKLYFDGAANMYGCGIGAVLVSPQGDQFPTSARLTFPYTNNIAEYEACIMGLKMAVEMGIEELEVFGDSSLIIFQTRGEFKTKDPKLIPYHQYLSKMTREFKEVSFSYIPRSQNQFADALATLASMIQATEGTKIKPVQVRMEEEPAICAVAEIREPWFHDIKTFLQTGTFPEGTAKKDQKAIRRLASHFLLSGTELYKRSFDTTLLRCVDETESERLMREVHEGVCGPHMNGHMLARKIMRIGYFWLTMESDCIKHVRHCHLCQIHASQIHAPPKELQSMTTPWPFSMWGIDVIGPISPNASNGHRFILVAIDYFTKWIEASSYVNVTKGVVVRFIKKDIIARYGAPESIITDNGTNLNNRLMTELCQQFKIKHRNSTPYRPQMNGAVEAANKNIKRIIEKMTVTHKDWHEMLPFALMAYRTSIRVSTGATPYSLVYGTEAVLPIEVEIPSLRVLAEAELEEAEWVQKRIEQLNLVDEKRLTAVCHGQLYQQRMARAFNKRVRPRSFQEGNLVLKKVLPNVRDHRGKFAPGYEGPFIVKRVLTGGALSLARVDGPDLKDPVNSDAVKLYYP